MSVYEPIPGGLRKIATAHHAANQPMWIGRMLAHNQELISDTFQPRMLVNDWAPEKEVVTIDSGRLIGQWGRFRRLPGVAVKVRVNIALAAATSLVVIALPAMATRNWNDGDGELHYFLRYANTDHYDFTITLAGGTREWFEFTVYPPRRGRWWYLTLWGVTVGEETHDLYSVSAVERKIFTAV